MELCYGQMSSMGLDRRVARNGRLISVGVMAMMDGAIMRGSTIQGVGMRF